MDWVLLGLLVLVLWWLWDIRRVLGVRRLLYPLTSRPVSRSREGFRGAVAPARYVVVRWPSGQYVYNGCQGAEARTIYEHAHPAPGEEVEFWELGDCRGHKP